MRLIHIADLHAGKTLGRLSRNPDLAHALEQVVAFAKDSRADAVLVAGDVFDKANPDNESKELIFDFFLRLKDIGCEAIVISGNHDSYDFMKSISGLTRLANVHIFDRPSKDNCIYSLGDVAIACLPYPSERVLTPADEDSKRSYGELVARFITYLAQRARSLSDKTILLAHLFVAGSRYTNTEKVASVTLHYAVQPSSLEGFDYVALGHVHRYQRIETAPVPAYYTGSMFQLDFSEAGEEKFFNFIVFDEDLKVEKIKVDQKIELKEVSIKQDEVSYQMGKLKTGHNYLKINLYLENKTTAGSLLEMIKKDLGEKLVRIELITEGERTPEPEFQEEHLNPIEIYRLYYQQNHGGDLPPDLEKTFVEILKEAE